MGSDTANQFEINTVMLEEAKALEGWNRLEDTASQDAVRAGLLYAARKGKTVHNVRQAINLVNLNFKEFIALELAIFRNDKSHIAVNAQALDHPPIARPSLESAQLAISTLLAYIGEDPAREGLLETPARVVKAWLELTEGNASDPALHLEKDFGLEDVEGVSRYSSMIISSGIPFVSSCEHHMMPFTGEAHLAYIPGASGRVVGLSKLARVVEGYSKRLQVQERMTSQIKDALEQKLEPAGIAVVVIGRHSCQHHRGVKKDGRMVTTAFTGQFLEPYLRAEFLKLIDL
jgi:GTP cyclohydrolase I